MTKVIVNDASCLIDLRKARLLHAMMSLPFHFVVPYPIRHDEVLDFTPQEWQMLDESGVETYDLPPDAVSEAISLKQHNARLSTNDCFCLVSCKRHGKAVLLTGDARLRSVAEADSIEVHGVLWIIDQLSERDLSAPNVLIAALETWRDDPAVFLPLSEIANRLRRLN